MYYEYRKGFRIQDLTFIQMNVKKWIKIFLLKYSQIDIEWLMHA